MDRSKEVEVRSVGIVSGTIWIGDPRYLIQDDDAWRVMEEGRYALGEEPTITEPLGQNHGLWISSPGDRIYGVVITHNEQGKVSSVTVNFNDPVTPHPGSRSDD